MNQIVAREFLAAWLLLERELAKAEKGNQQQLATEAERSALVLALIEVHYQFGRMGLAQSKGLADEFLEQLQNPAWHRDRMGRQAVLQGLPISSMPKEVPLPSFAMIYSQLRGIVGQAMDEMDAIRMAVVFKDHARFFEQADLLGPKFHKAASIKINAEIKAAGNCLASDLNTAAVFHLMRAAEFGLRRLAKRLRVPLKYPLEFADWGKVIDGCGKQLEALNGVTRGKKKVAKLEFYANAVSDCRAFKETWRDCVMHARRKDFTFKEAKGVNDRVRDFILSLAAMRLLK
jgi:hypothetical protein